MNACERYEEMISALLDGELDAEAEAELRAHMAKCAHCSEMYRAFSAVGEALREQDVPDTLHDAIMTKVHAAEKAGRTQRTIVRLRPILAAAACLIVLVGTVFALKNTLGFGRGAMKSAPAAAPMATNENSVFAAGGSAEAAASYDMAMPEDAGISESKAEFAVPPTTAASGGNAAMHAPDATREAAGREENGSAETTGAMDDSASDTLYFTVRVEALTEDGFVGVVTDTGDQTLFKEGESVTVLTDDAEMDVLKLGACVSVRIAADEQPDDGAAVRALTIATAE